ncbi:ACT domain-containing protein [Candidatus Contubernalis alkaliaceticus]|uniref:ACT domain-containing protein n=1 Tax=Candidatus Contubernalis alkaliaceticus TaxID=338645 RepID=UPI001F4C4644|nr:ACT domain-containing protein [Candidatus Contubernalis alkalaceticus]UNC93420.1 ACT domain-containing protein [Candidatus Contubernalis alkalaceticus]
MKVNQLSVFLENKSGRLARVTKVLGENNINIRALSIADTTDFGILRIIVSQPKEAYNILRSEGFVVTETDVIAVCIPDKPGGLGQVLEVLEKQSVNIEYLYAFVGNTSTKNALVVFRVEDCDKAVEVLKSNGIQVVDEEKVYQL